MNLPDDASLLVGLSAVIVAADVEQPYVLATRQGDAGAGLPFGPFDPSGHRTFELGLRDWVTAQTGFELGYVEQLYTFGDRGRELPRADYPNAPENARIISIAYLGITPERTEIGGAFNAAWRSWYYYFPWEDHRNGPPAMIADIIEPTLMDWAGDDFERRDRARLAFGLDGRPWIEERVIERYELLYEASMTPESRRDLGVTLRAELPGEPMLSDHRRMLAVALSRLRGKIKYRPVVFEMTPETFTLSELQQVVESLLGLPLHKQNFRRAMEKNKLVEGTGELSSGTGGRPAELFRFRRETLRKKAALGIAAPVTCT